MTRPLDELKPNRTQLTEDELRQALQTSRELVRRSHILIELSESDPELLAPIGNPGD